MENKVRRDKSTHYKAGITLLKSFSSYSNLFFKVSSVGAAAISLHNLLSCLFVLTIGKFVPKSGLNLTGE